MKNWAHLKEADAKEKEGRWFAAILVQISAHHRGPLTAWNHSHSCKANQALELGAVLPKVVCMNLQEVNMSEGPACTESSFVSTAACPQMPAVQLFHRLF